MKKVFCITLLLCSVFANAMTPPTLSTPSNNNIITGFDTYFYVNQVTGATGYQFQYDTVSTFNSSWLKTDTSSTNYLPPSVLLRKNQKYYWRARAYKAGDTSAWASAFNFTCSPVIHLASPQDLTSGNIRTLTTTFMGSDTGIGYIFEADTTPLFNSPLFVNRVMPSEQFSDSVLFDFGRKIYWRARAFSPLGDSTEWTYYYRQYTIIKQAPIDGSTGLLNTDPQYIVSWTNPYLSATEVMADTSLLFNSPTLISRITNPGALRDTLRNMYFGKNYYVKVRSVYGGHVSDWSVIRNLKIYTNGVINSPYEGQAMSIQNVSFSWRNMNGTRVHLIFGTDPALTNILKDTITTGSSYSYPQLLQLSKNYYFKIRYFHDKDTTPWLNRSFKTSGGQPALSGINNAATNVNVRPRFMFRKETWATRYVMEIDTGIAFQSTPSSFFIQTDTFTYDKSYYHYLDTSIRYAQRYVWRVYAIMGSDTGTALVRTFTTAVAPVNYFPQNNFIGTGTNTNALVTGITGSTYMQWEIDSSSAFNSPLLSQGTAPHVPDNFSPQYVEVEFPVLKFHIKYYWRTRCINPVDTGDWSAPFNFLTTQDVWGYSPADKSTNQPMVTTIEWGIQGSGNDLRYEYQLSTDSMLTGAPIVSLHSDSSSRVTVSLQQFLTTYYWRARAINQVDTSRWSAIFRFTTVPTPTVEKVVLMFPFAGEKNVAPGSVPLQWYSAANAVTYDVETSNDANFSSILASTNTDLTGVYFSGVQPSKRYYWHVRGRYNSTIIGSWSNTFWFETAPATGVAEQQFNDAVKSYPNPANELFTLECPGDFSIKVTDIS